MGKQSHLLMKKRLAVRGFTVSPVVVGEKAAMYLAMLLVNTTVIPNEKWTSDFCNLKELPVQVTCA